MTRRELRSRSLPIRDAGYAPIDDSSPPLSTADTGAGQQLHTRTNLRVHRDR